MKNREIGQKPTANPKSEIADWTAWNRTPSELMAPRSCVFNLRFLILDLRWAFVQFLDSFGSLAIDSSSILMPSQRRGGCAVNENVAKPPFMERTGWPERRNLQKGRAELTTIKASHYRPL